MQISLALLDDSDGLNISGKQRIQITSSPSPTKIELRVDGNLVATLSGAAMSAPYTLDTTKFADGTHRIMATGFFKTRKSSAQVAVSVKNTIAAGSYGEGAYGSGNFGG